MVARLYGVGDVRVEEAPEPVPGPGRSLVKVTAVGLCGSDLHWYADGGIGDTRIAEPLVVGHESAGVVQSGPFKGRRVAIDPAIPCRGCEPCLEGNPNLCGAHAFAGDGRTAGGLQEYVSWPDACLHPLPDSVSDAQGAVLEPLGVAIHALDLGRVRAGTPVAVIGCGPIGLLLVQLARGAGASRVIASDPLPWRREAALRMGADEVLDPYEADARVRVAGIGAYAVFEAAGNDGAVADAVHAARPGARVVLVGIPEPDSVTFPASAARRKGLTLAFSRRMKDVYPRAIALAEAGRVDLDGVVGDRYPLSRAAEAFAQASARKGLKVLVEP